ncbi:winged helix-turn-helix transcriptional regulator [Flavivirga algicola]|uniref:Helix-turn-helix transcriptional regulator n=1 Tax=Flavivirga algicola TaxID=2729136 RepID=A0ABX1RW58_9FLAO|nr:helix-turn-helix domain-containing protein [Flavivirga algicola]NMH87230.1 helix-turn-helix transcriptional regulator [Flavivirga algicola]
MEAEKKIKKISYLESLNARTVFDENCIIQVSFALIADKWTLLTLTTLMQGTKRNSDLQKQVVGISPKMLSQTLKALLKYGMISRKVYPEVPPRVEYTLTEFGASLVEPLSGFYNWSVDWEDKLRAVYKKTKGKNELLI